MRNLLGAARGGARCPTVDFVPHSGPFVRGIHATLFLRAQEAARRRTSSSAQVNAFYGAELVHSARSTTLPKLTEVVGTNRLRLGIATRDRTLIVTSVVDNLTKGAAGGGVQWMNRLFDLDEDTGLEAPRTASQHDDRRPHRSSTSSTRSTSNPSAATASGSTRSDGRRYLDFYGGHAVALLGYNHPRLVATLDSEARRLFFQSNAVELEIRERAAEALLALRAEGVHEGLPRELGRRGERERAARRVPRDEAEARRRGARRVPRPHRRGLGAHRRQRQVVRVPAAAVRGDVGRRSTTSRRSPAAITRRRRGGHRRAGPGPRRRPRAVARLPRDDAPRSRRERGAILIFDEVQCGMGRTGWPFAAQHYGVTPDILTTAKGLAGGFPAAAMLVGDELAARVKKGDLGTTFGAGPMACALIEAVITAIEAEDLLPRVRRLSAMLREQCVRGPVESVQGLGYLLGLRTKVPAKRRPRRAARARHPRRRRERSRTSSGCCRR